MLLSYEDEDTVARHPELWPGIPYWRGNQVKAQALIRYLETMKSCGRPGGLFVAGTNLTESPGYVLAHPTQSLQKLTLPALPSLSAWVREQSPGPGPGCTNIIAGDFVGADTFVTDVIGLNRKLLQGPRHRPGEAEWSGEQPGVRPGACREDPTAWPRRPPRDWGCVGTESP